ncbi:hypothetical protein ACFLWY_00970 [Chloroflexota bacterium]
MTDLSMGSNETTWWYSDEAAEEPISFGTQSWTAKVYICCSPGQPDTANLDVTVWKVASDNTPTQLASGTQPLSTTTTLTAYTITLTTDTSQDIAVGDRIGCRLDWTGNKAVKIHYDGPEGEDGESWLKTPSNDPGFPVPELSSLVLLSAGLAAAFVYLVISNRRRRATSNQQ